MRKMQITTTVRNLSAPLSMVVIKMSNNKGGKGSEEKGTFTHHWWEVALVQPLCKILWGFLKKSPSELPHYLATSFVGTYRKEVE